MFPDEAVRRAYHCCFGTFFSAVGSEINVIEEPDDFVNATGSTNPE
eukprot:CAMPEP_0180223366 /NCGR_PEP_ID=MMETSP0987-20121128/21336_1 /TAXON_ID=697907 /ORGANISM="non described non described, Strain CCMP2293" /LENGTH=45 /DNA_ID= /DNA_START= /DNA_END= /DNA_ORIENTATION=